MRVLFLGNCQTGAYAHLIKSSGLRDINVDAVRVFEISPLDRQRLAERLSNYDLIVSHPLSATYGPLETGELRRSCKNIVVISNIYFRGFQPDCIALGPSGKKWGSPIGLYHSQVAFFGWCEGATAAQCVARIADFDPALSRRVFEYSANELGEREKDVDVPIAPFIVGRPDESWKMFATYNHPRIQLQKIYLERIFEHIGIKQQLKDCSDILANTTRFPVYPGVLRALGIAVPEACGVERILFGVQRINLPPLEFFDASLKTYNELYAKRPDMLLEAFTNAQLLEYERLNVRVPKMRYISELNGSEGNK